MPQESQEIGETEGIKTLSLKLLAIARRLILAIWGYYKNNFPSTTDFLTNLQRAIIGFGRHNNYKHAAGLSFWLLISLLPLISLVFKGMSTLMWSHDYGEFAKVALIDVVPFLPKDFVDGAMCHSQGLGNQIFSWIVLLLGGYLGFKELPDLFRPLFSNKIIKHNLHHKNDHRTKLSSKSIILFISDWCKKHAIQIKTLLKCIIFIITLLVVISLGISHGILKPNQYIVWTLLTGIIGFGVASILFQGMPPPHKVRWPHAFVGAAFFIVLWFLAKKAFVVYLAHQMTWNIMYGPIMSIIAGLTFLYYTSALLLLSAGITAELYKDAQSQGVTVAPVTSPTSIIPESN